MSLKINQDEQPSWLFCLYNFLMLSTLLHLYAAAQKPKRSKVQPTPEDYKCLVRVSDGKRKISTVLAGKDLSRFQDSYSTLLKVRCIIEKKEIPVLCLNYCQLLIHHHRHSTFILFCPSFAGPYGCP